MLAEKPAAIAPSCASYLYCIFVRSGIMNDKGRYRQHREMAGRFWRDGQNVQKP